MLKRRFFFWLENLKINPVERRVISILMVIFLISGVVNWNLTPHPAFDKDNYRDLIRTFKKRKVMLGKEKEKLMARYFQPADNPATAVAIADTVSGNDSLQHQPEKEPGDGDSETNRRIHVNEADVATLKTLPGIGPVYARRIVKFRNEHGPFISYHELLKIKGIGEKRLKKLKPFITLNDTTENQ